MNLIIDVGNTLVKLAVFESKAILFKETVLKSDLKKGLATISENYPNIQKAILSKVASISEANLQRIRKIAPLYILDNSLNFPFVNAYTTPKTLGMDRMALASAAAASFVGKNVLVIDVGSCITYDFITSTCHYKGGAISPGISMRYKALHQFTAQLPLLDPNKPVHFIGHSTATSMHAGVVLGAGYEIDGMIDRYKQEIEDLTVILTGGDAHFLRDSLKNSIFANPNFLLEGLNYIVEFNQHS